MARRRARGSRRSPPAPRRTPTRTRRTSRPPRPWTSGSGRRATPRRPRSSSSWRTSAAAIAPGSRSHSSVEPTMSDRQNVVTPVGSVAAQPARSRSTSSPGVAGRRAGSVASPRRIAFSSCSARAGSIPSQAGSTPCGRGAGQQREGRRRQPVDVARARRRGARRELRSAVAGRSRAAPEHQRRGRQPEVHELDVPAAGQDQVRGLDVAVHDRRVLRVQEHQRLGGLGEVGHHAGGRQAGRSPLGQDPREVGPVDPVHRDDVLVVDEEVLADQRQRRVRLRGRAAGRASREQAPRAPRRRAPAGSSARRDARGDGRAP